MDEIQRGPHTVIVLCGRLGQFRKGGEKIGWGLGREISRAAQDNYLRRMKNLEQIISLDPSLNGAVAQTGSCDAPSQKVGATPASRETTGAPFGWLAGSGDAASPAPSATRASQLHAWRRCPSINCGVPAEIRSWGERIPRTNSRIEPLDLGRDALPRVRAGRQVGPTGFMESLLFLADLLTGHELAANRSADSLVRVFLDLGSRGLGGPRSEIGSWAARTFNPSEPILKPATKPGKKRKMQQT